MPVVWTNPMRTVAGTTYDDNGVGYDYWVDITTSPASATGVVTMLSAVNEHPTRAQEFTVTANGITRTFALPARTMRTAPVVVLGAQILAVFAKAVVWTEVDFSLPG